MLCLNCRPRAWFSNTRAMIASLCVAVLLATGCHHAPTINTNVTADGHMITEAPTPGNSGPLHEFTVPHRDGEAGGPAVAVIDVDGILLNMDFTGPASAGENPVSLFRERLDEAAADPCTRAVVLRINSPGGGVNASDMMYHELMLFKARTQLPIVVSLLDTATGGAYYLALGGDQIIAHPMCVTGGIGVILNLYNISDFLTKQDVASVPIKSGEHIDIGTSLHAATPEQRMQLETMANEFHDRFRQLVLKTRPLIQPSQENVFDGRIFTGTQALQLRLVDSVGYLDDAVGAARGLAGLSNSRVVMYHRCNDRARTQFSITPNTPMQGEVAPLNFPGLSRSRMPTFLYLWQPEPMMEKLGGK
jgi:protease IV